MKTGRQNPTFEVVGDYAYTYGPDVVEMFEEDGGATFYPSQKYEMDLFLARNADGSPSALTIGISKPRQNGKSYAARYYAVYMAVFEHRQVLYSAHHSATTNKMFKALSDLLESPERFPEFAAEVKCVSHSRGYEGFYFNDWKDADGNTYPGGCIEFATRTNSGARGGTYSVIVIDESQELTPEQQEALLPVMSAASDVRDKTKMPQQIFIGTPPGPTCNGTVFHDMYRMAHSDDQGSAWWLEWAIDADIPLTEITRERAIEYAYETNPAMGYRIAEKTILNEYDNMSIDGYSRERLGRWTPETFQREEYAISSAVWDACVSDDMKPEGKTAYGVKFSADGMAVCLCGAVIPKEGPARISMIQQEPIGAGLQWLADWLNARPDKACCVVIDGKNGVDVLIDKITQKWRYKGSVIRPSANQMIAAVSMLVDALNEQSITWYRQQDLLRESAVTSTKRKILGGWGFGGDNSIPVEACALAFWGAKTTKRDPARKMRVG